jgi:hypothetical protein
LISAGPPADEALLLDVERHGKLKSILAQTDTRPVAGLTWPGLAT